MALDECSSSPDYGEGPLCSVSAEQMSLSHFATALSASYLICEPGIGDDGNTRQEASLLMSLMSTNPTYDIEVMSVENSCLEPSAKRAEFRFVCPSLSLEWANAFSSSADAFSTSAFTSDGMAAASSPNHDKQLHDAFQPPSILLSRPLVVDDRDALRLSSDAMARNLHQTFQKALDWRTDVWVDSLSKTLVKMEKEMIQNGSAIDDTKALLQSGQARLLLALRDVRDKVTVATLTTRFRVLPVRMDDTVKESPPQKRRRMDFELADIREAEDYCYSVKHSLLLECHVEIESPAGNSEIVLEVPGYIEGTFLCGSSGSEVLKTVVVDLHTLMLASMIDKAAKKIIRSSVECVLQNMPSSDVLFASIIKNATISIDHENTGSSKAITPRRRPFTSLEEDTGFAAIVTPRASMSGMHREGMRDNSLILPIPDDFTDSSKDKPRRISPQPGSPSMDKINSYYLLQTPLESELKSLPLISPPPCDSMEYMDYSGNGPSLPVLVEVACRAMRAN